MDRCVDENLQPPTLPGKPGALGLSPGRAVAGELVPTRPEVVGVETLG
jgi:hypothetical protein